jgi:RNA polymerase sigma-70 factor (ECF subfamily)
MRATEFDEPGFLASLRQGDASAYRLLVRRLHASLVRFAASIIGSHAQAEEVVQDSWLAVHAGIGQFEGRSSLQTWIFSIVMNRARTRVSREGRLVGLGALMEGTPPGERGVPLSEFKPDGHWAEAPKLWDQLDPERIVAGRQLWDHVQAAIDRLPAGQRAVILLRDMEGCDAEEARQVLDISAENQRVLLHRARSRIRREIDLLVGVAPAERIAPGRQARATAGKGRGEPGHGGKGLLRLLHVLALGARGDTPPAIEAASGRQASQANAAFDRASRPRLPTATPA